ncbi:hypothetical protein J2755_002244 [Methanohalophilus levihalophilus]|uniref:sensor domain-containing protein n=1 Tax=Methanohalophilus levihalophilus TaxID=1431282 RepID=UPI001AE75776|nr:sensor domain-containing protein [Methanohalophilus levihalophilus]MBP2031281.1 hypothetical protein [Methanohalophilus levihalophilus]
MNIEEKAWSQIFGVPFRRQTYLNMLYILFTFPLGTAYFIFLISGLLIGLSFSIILLGIPVLLLVFIAWWELVAFERELAIHLLGVQIQPLSEKESADGGFWKEIKNKILNPVAWKGLAFLFIKFPLGIFSLIVSITLGGISVIFFLTPLFYQSFTMGIMDLTVSSLPEATFFSIVGVLLFVLTLHVINTMATISGYLARVMLGGHKKGISYQTVPDYHKIQE